jgi:hypothetical protein
LSPVHQIGNDAAMALPLTGLDFHES